MPAAPVDVVVVGAGFAGLCAARSLQAGGASVAVLEARERVGGRARTDQLAGAAVDLGGQWIGPGQDRIGALVAELGFRTVPQRTAGAALVLHEDGAVSQAEGEAALALAQSTLAAYLTAQAALDELAATVPLDRPWAAPRARELDATTLASWMAANVDDLGALRLLELTIHAVFAADPAALSLLHVAHYIRSGGGLASLTGTEGGAQQDRVAGGMQPVAAALAAALGDGTVRLACPVLELTYGPSGLVAAGPWGELGARLAVVAIPPTLAGRISYDPPLPAERDQLTQRVPAGSVIKVQVAYERAWWVEEGRSGQLLAPHRPLGVTFDGSPPGLEPGIITAFFEAHHAVAARELGERGRRELVLGHLAAGFGGRAASPVAYAELDWSEERWTRGCYGGHFPPGVLTVFGPSLRAPVGPIHWAGTETSEVWAGYIDGAIRSGERAAEEALAAL